MSALYRQFMADLSPLLAEETAKINKRAERMDGLTAIIREAREVDPECLVRDAQSILIRRAALDKLRALKPEYFE